MKILIFIAVFVFTANVYAQRFTGDFDIELEEVSTAKYDTTDRDGKLFVSCMFASPIIEQPLLLNRLKNKVIYEVELVYSDYSTVKDIDKLNRQRLAVLYGYLPSLFEDGTIRWKSIKQDAKTYEDAKKLFHGFVITYRGKVSTSEEISLIKRILSGKTGIEDSVVTSVLLRNKKWKNLLIVCDVTGSMSPYIAQVVQWLKLHSMDSTVKAYMFFNDGDLKDDDEKIVGNVGGLYNGYATKFDSVLKHLYTAMTNGSGGDIPENNIEATISGIAQFPNCDSILMVADNYATPRDMELLSLLKKPIHVIVCGATDYTINPEYIRLAEETGGSIHTIERDIYYSTKSSEGKIVDIGKYRYIMKSGKWVRLRGS